MFEKLNEKRMTTGQSKRNKQEVREKWGQRRYFLHFKNV